MHPIIKTFVSVSIMFYVLLYPDGKEVVTLPETPTDIREKKGKKSKLCKYKME